MGTMPPLDETEEVTKTFMLTHNELDADDMDQSMICHEDHIHHNKRHMQKSDREHQVIR